MSKTPILILGATGYLGSSVLSRLLAHPKKDTFEITAFVRSEEKAKKLETFGLKTVVGSYQDYALIEQLAEKAHVLFSIADADSVDLTNAYLAGLKKRHAATGVQPILIHTSGTGVFMYGEALTKGMAFSEKIHYDDDPDDIERSTPDDALHRNIDLLILEADKAGYLKSYLVLPSTIWGIAQNPLVAAGIANNRSIQLPGLFNASIARGQAGMVGKGMAYWPSVNVGEQADFYIILYDAIVANPDKVGHGRNGYYYGENGEHTWLDIAQAIGKAMVTLGLSKSAEPTSFTTEELSKYFGSEYVGSFFGTNCRVRANHARSLGWKPKLTSKDMLEDIEAELAVFANKA